MTAAIFRIVLIAGMAVLFQGSALANPAASGCADDSRACLIAAARSYLEALVHQDGSKVPLASDVRRTEQGNVTAVGDQNIRAAIQRLPPMNGYSNARFFVDERNHQVIFLALLHLDIKESKPMPSEPGHMSQLGPGTVHIAERFKVKHGLIEEVEAIFYNQQGTADGNSGWPDQ